ncbi:MAG: hypothetical protein H6706_02970 [Myxococcales bacterium]|nr:hypothetical protein [Myxococcales bacterium]
MRGWMGALLLMGCASTVRVGTLQPGPDGTMEVVLVDGAAPTQEARRLRWRDGVAEVLADEAPAAALSFAAGAEPPAFVARRDPLVWLGWAGPTPRYEAREAGALAFGGALPGAPVRLDALPTRHALVILADQALLAGAEGVQPLGSPEVEVAGVSPAGAVLFEEGGRQQLRLPGGQLVYPERPVRVFAAAGGAVWLDDGEAALLRVDEASGQTRRLAPVPGFPRLLAADAEGYLWLGQGQPVNVGDPIPLMRWHPESGKRERVNIPSKA